MSLFTFPCSGCNDNKGVHCNEDCISWWMYLAHIKLPQENTESLTGEQFLEYGIKDFSQ